MEEDFCVIYFTFSYMYLLFLSLLIRIVYFCHQSIQQRKKLQKCRQCTKILPKIIFQKQFSKQIFFTLKFLQNLTFFSMSQSKSLAGVVITGAGQNFRLVLHIFVNVNLLKITYCESSQVWKIFSWNPPPPPPPSVVGKKPRVLT